MYGKSSVEPLNLIVGGALLAAVGAGVMVATWPRLEPTFDGQYTTGSSVGVVAGSVGLIIGQVIALVGIVAQGVWLGRLKFEQESTKADAAEAAAEATAVRRRAATAAQRADAEDACPHTRTKYGVGASGGTLCLDCGKTLGQVR
jgi:hypothetical protein